MLVVIFFMTAANLSFSVPFMIVISSSSFDGLFDGISYIGGSLNRFASSFRSLLYPKTVPLNPSRWPPSFLVNVSITIDVLRDATHWVSSGI